MEEIHRELTQPSNHSGEGNNEIRMEMVPVESNRRKLYVASKMGSVQSLKTLIQDDPNVIRKVLISTSNIETPLHVSVSHGHLEFTRLLLDQNPELATELDALQRTPLHLASASGEMEIVRILLEKNISACLARDLNGLIPLHHAVISGREEHCGESNISAAKRKVKRWWEKHLKYKGDWLQEVQGTMMLVATVIASVTFQGAINPPGGVWQQDTPFDHNTGDNKTASIAGTAVMANKTGYTDYLIANMISFFASICVILLIIGRLPLKNRICAWLLTVTVCASVASLAFSYMSGIRIVNHVLAQSTDLRVTFWIAASILNVMVDLVVVSCVIFPFIVWVVKLLIWVVKLLIRVVKLSQCYT